MKPQIVYHRINKISEVREIPREIGVEIDIRASGRDLILNHEPFESGDNLKEFLSASGNRFIIFNIKEAGIEAEVIKFAKNAGIEHYFLLDVEFPYLYRASRAGVRDIAVRYSEDECIDIVTRYKSRVDWVWIDTNTELPLNPDIITQFKGIKTALVCPSRWGRPHDIPEYISKMNALNFCPDVVMTSPEYASLYTDGCKVAFPQGE